MSKQAKHKGFTQAKITVKQRFPSSYSRHLHETSTSKQPLFSPVDRNVLRHTNLSASAETKHLA